MISWFPNEHLVPLWKPWEGPPFSRPWRPSADLNGPRFPTSPDIFRAPLRAHPSAGCAAPYPMKRCSGHTHLTSLRPCHPHDS